MEAAELSEPKTCGGEVKPSCCRKKRAASTLSLFSPFAKQQENGAYHLTLAVDGIHCARCIWAIESNLSKEEAITQVRVNMSTKRLVIEWQGDATQADQFAQLVESLGYPVKPFEKAPQNDLSEDRFLLRCLAAAGFAMGNIMIISVALWSSDQELMGMATRDLFHWISAIIALPTLAYAGRPFFHSALSVLKHGRTNMDVPISLALILATMMSIFETIHHGEHAYFDSAVMLLFFLLIGRWLDARARGKARENAEGLLSMMQGIATVIEDEKSKHIAIKELRAGMVVRVAVGEQIPTDAKVVTGTSEIDTSLVTGETIPRSVSPGDDVYGGTINMSAPLTCEVMKASDDSLLADIIRLMEQAEQGRARYVRLADKAAKLYTPVVHTLAAAAFIGWYGFGGVAWQEALLIAITTLIITCPCALGLAVPVVQVLASGWLMKRGILIKSGDALERLATIDTAVLDKTGTLTLGSPTLTTKAEDMHLQLAASLATHSHHPLSRTLAQCYNGELVTLDAVEEIPAMGIEATYKGQTIRLGRRSWCGDENAAKDTLQELWLQIGGTPIHRFTFTDPLREDTAEVVHLLQQEGLTLYMLSGDRQEVADHVAQELSITHVQAECKPADKTASLAALKNAGHKVLMVGDGLNDAPALAAADISISPASGIDITQNTADMVFQGDMLCPIYSAWHMAHFSTSLVKQNFALAIAYNCIAVPLAVAGHVTPLVAALAMSSSSLVVVANSFRINLSHRWDV